MQEYQSIHWIKNQLHITQAVKQKPQLNYIIGKLDRGEISVNEAEETIKFEEEYDAEQKEKGKWRRLRAEVMEEDGNKCRECEDASHLDVYTITPYHDKYDKGNLETLCKDCHELKMEFYDEFALVKKLTSFFQYLTGMSGKKWFQYDTIGYLAAKKEKEKERQSSTTTIVVVLVILIMTTIWTGWQQVLTPNLTLYKHILSVRVGLLTYLLTIS